jgi:hypothetical protein
MSNNYEQPEVFEVGRAQDIVLGFKGTGILDSDVEPQPSVGSDIDESDE